MRFGLTSLIVTLMCLRSILSQSGPAMAKCMGYKNHLRYPKCELKEYIDKEDKACIREYLMSSPVSRMLGDLWVNLQPLFMFTKVPKSVAQYSMIKENFSKRP